MQILEMYLDDCVDVGHAYSENRIFLVKVSQTAEKDPSYVAFLVTFVIFTQ